MRLLQQMQWIVCELLFLTFFQGIQAADANAISMVKDVTRNVATAINDELTYVDLQFQFLLIYELLQYRKLSNFKSGTGRTD